MTYLNKFSKWVLPFLFVAGVVNAQVMPGGEAAELKTKSAVDSHGIDMISGEAMIMGVNMSIGTEQGGISISDSSFNGMRVQYKGQIVIMQSTGNSDGGCDLLPTGQYISLSTGNNSAVFQYVEGSTPLLVRGRGTLQWGPEVIYRDLDGTEYKYELFSIIEGFSASVSNASQCVIRKPVATLVKITKPNGEIIDINYRKGEPFEFPPVFWIPSVFGQITPGYFVSVQSSLGWIFKKEIVSESGDITSSVGKTFRSEYLFANTSYEYCNPDASVACGNMSLSWPKFQLEQKYSKVGAETDLQIVSHRNGLTNPLGKTTTLNYGYSETDNLIYYYDVTHTSPTGLLKKYRKQCEGRHCSNTNDRRVISYTQGSVIFSGYGSRSLEPSSYANPYTVMNEGFGPEGKVHYVPALVQFPFYFYDNLSRIHENSYTHNSKWLLESIGYRNDAKTKASYDSRGNITSITQLPKIEGETPPVTTLHYPPESTCATTPKICNKPDWITDQSGVTTVYSYHAQSGNVETITKPAVNGIQAQTRYKYEQKTPYVKNSSGSLMANPGVWVLTEVSECMTQTLNTCVGAADEKRIVYSDFTNNLLPQKMTMKNGDESIRLETVTEYDIYGNVVAIDGPRTGTDDKVFYFYDLMRQKIGEIGVDPDGTGPLPRQAIKTVYNDDGKVTSVNKGVTFGTTKSDLDVMTVKQQAATEYSTDHGLPIVERFYAAGILEKVTQKSYDNKLRVDCVAQRLNRDAWSTLPTSACSRGEAGPEGNDRITKYNYDLTGALLSTISGYETSLRRVDRANTYDPVNGLLKTEADDKGNTTFYKYDNFNRLFKTVYPNPANGAVESATDYTQTNYKSGSSLVDSVRLRDGLMINFSEYDPLGRVKTKSGALSESFTYNNFNQVLTHTNNSTGGVSQNSSYVFNSLGWLKNESRTAGGVSLGSVSYGHDAFGRRTSLTWPDNFSVIYDYKVNGIESEYLRKITESNSTLLASFDYYDNGRRKSLTRGNGVVTSYWYNDLDQLRNQSTDVGGTNTSDDISEEFKYTLSGQFKTHSLTVVNNNYVYTPTVAATINYTPDALNRIASLNGASFGYDGRGNLTSDNTGASYAYNANNLLLNATTNGVATTLIYDAENRLHSVTKSGNTTKFAYDGTDLIAETNASNTVLRRYVHGPETDDPIVWYEGSGTGDKRYYTANRQGSIVGVTLQSGMSTSINAYDEYGIQKLNTIGRFQYTGQTWIPEIGLYYYKARFYNPSLGRFMQTDPIGYKDGMNWYAYVGNDPINKTDPMGMAQCGSSLQGGRLYECNKALDDIHAARDNARHAAEGLTGVAGRMKDDKLTDEDKAAIAVVEKRFGKGFASEKGLTKLANGLNKAADKIGANGEGAVLKYGGGDGTEKPAHAAPLLGTITLYKSYFNITDNKVREQASLHEASHLAGAWRDKYINGGENPLYDRTGLGGGYMNADTYACAVYPSVCGF